ncbi:hypothetical protein LUZ60_014504 [Juncus effusus]|nr:hypothetical protein LUZ60_014504 [Juncus effusus]
MARSRHFCCVTQSKKKPQTTEAKHGSKQAACICCIGRHHQNSGLCLSTKSPKLNPRTTPKARTPKTPKTPRARHTCCGGRTPRTPHRRHGASRRWFSAFRNTLSKSPLRSVAVMDGGNNEVKVYNSRVAEEAAATTPLKADDGGSSNDEYILLVREGFSREDVAAVTIQAYFRGHLARRAFKALRSLVRLQAVARGAYVRRQAEVAIHCMQALVRLQVRVRARQILTKSKEATTPLLQK